MDANTLINQALSAAASGHKEEVLLHLAQGDAEEGLIDFVRLLWPMLEPGREFVEGWALHAMCEHLEAVESGQIRNLIINVPPGCMKSLLTGVFFPAWIWGPRNRPERRFVSWSYNEALTIRDNRKLRRLVGSSLYHRLWQDRFAFVTDQNEKRLFENDKTGFSFASGVMGGGTGHRGDFLRLDDPHKVGEAESEQRREDTNRWVSETMTTRRSDDDSATVIVMQRVHHRDVSGFMLASDLGFEHLCLPMRFEEDHPHRTKTILDFRDPRKEDGELLWPERFSESKVEELEKALAAWGGSFAVAGQLQQRPVPRGGGMFKEEFAQYVDVPERGAFTVRGWDLAASKDKRAAWTAGVKLTRTRDGRIIIEDVRRFRGTPYEVREAILDCARKDGRNVRVSIPQDPGQAGVAQKVEFIRTLHGYDVSFSPESGDKTTRAQPIAAQWEAGNVWLVRASWNLPFILELCSFPVGDYKDQVDALSRAYHEANKDSGGGGSSNFGPSLIM